MPKTTKCWNCLGHGMHSGLGEYDVTRCATCDGSGRLCDHLKPYPCQACIEDLELEWYHHNNEINHKDHK